MHLRTPPSRSRLRTGTTLLELALTLSILGILLAVGAPAGRRTLDEVAVRAARDALASLAARARLMAVAQGGADLVVHLPGGRVRVVDGSGLPRVPTRNLGSKYGVRVVADGAPADSIALHWDALGIGRAAARTLRVRRGAAEARLTVSLYGRVRTW